MKIDKVFIKNLIIENLKTISLSFIASCIFGIALYSVTVAFTKYGWMLGTTSIFFAVTSVIGLFVGTLNALDETRKFRDKEEEMIRRLSTPARYGKFDDERF